MQTDPSSVGYRKDLAGLDTLLLSDTSKITELEILGTCGCPPIRGMTHVLQALARRPTLSKLELRNCTIGRDRDEARLLSLILAHNELGSADLAEVDPSLSRNTSIKMLDTSSNHLYDVESAETLRNILLRNKTITTLVLSGNDFGWRTGAVKCIADGLGSNSALLKIDLSFCVLGDGGVSTMAQTLGSRNTTLQKLLLGNNDITAMGVESPHYGSRPPVQPTYWGRRSKSPSEVFGKQCVTQTHTPLSFPMRYRR